MSEDRKNYIGQSFVFTLWVTAVLLLIRYVPAFAFLGVDIKRADILSDVVHKPKPADPVPVLPDFLAEQMPEGVPEPEEEEDTLFAAESVSAGDSLSEPSVAEKVGNGSETPVAEEAGSVADSGRLPVSSGEVSDTVSEGKETVRLVDPDVERRKPAVSIEDYTASGDVAAHLRRALASGESGPVRIAFLGDSFMEGDILTGDIREMLQEAFGGRGVGFVPVESIVSGLRQTVFHEFGGWEGFSIKKKNDSITDSRFLLSGYLYVPQNDDAFVSYKTSKFKKYLTDVTQAAFVFINPGNTVIRVTVNDSIERTFTPPSSPDIQRIVVRDVGKINSLTFRFSATEGFIAYGVLMDGDRGIAVDNYADRGSSGMQFYKLRKGYNQAYDAFCGYDMIVLEFGINVVAKDMTDYSWFERQMVSVVKNIRRCYPSADIILMGVGDRSTKEDGEYVTMPEIKSMIAHQRSIARKCGIGFFDVYSAMGGENSMVKFVEKRWAAKDYTHVSSAGAKVIAREFVDALLDEIEPMEGESR